MFNAGIMLGDNICQLMLVRYGGPNFQMDFVSFVLLMLRVEKMEGELVGRREGLAFLCSPHGLLTCPQCKQEGEQCGELWGTLATSL